MTANDDARRVYEANSRTDEKSMRDVGMTSDRLSSYDEAVDRLSEDWPPIMQIPTGDQAEPVDWPFVPPPEPQREAS